MKLSLLVLALLCSNISKGEDTVVRKDYTGSRNGRACNLSISTGSQFGDSVILDSCHSVLPTNYKAKIVDNKMTIPRGYAQIDESTDCTMVIKFDNNNNPISASMKVGSGFSPILRPKLPCNDLVQVK